MNTPILERYPFDYTGEATTNLVDGELHVIPPGPKNRIFTLVEGAAFSKSIKLRYGDGTYLRPWIDFQPVNLYPEATKAVGEACTGMVMIINESVTGYTYAEYQVVGGKYDHNSQAVEDLLWAAVSDDRPVFFPDILDRPSVYPPSPHHHDIFNETYGWDARVLLVDTWTTEVLEKADTDRLAGIRQAIKAVDDYLTVRNNHANELIDGHTHTLDAHAITKTQAGLAKLDNLPTANMTQARDGNRYDLRLTVGGAEAILSDALEAYSANLMKQGILPVSRWGNLTYLEPGVSGSFEGSAQLQTIDQRPAIVEVDGTLVRLRPGTNGTSIGVYYDYMLNAFTDPIGSVMVKTNSQYWPAAMGSEYKPWQLRKSTPDVLWGLAYKVSNFPTINSKFFIALTGESFDSSKHDVAFVNDRYTHSEYGVRSLTDRATLTLADGYVYCVDYCPWGTDRKVGFVILRIPVADIKSKTEVTWEFLKGWTAVGGIGGTMTGDAIYMANREVSTNAADNPMILIDEGMSATLYRGSYMFYIVSDSPGLLKIAYGGMMQYYTTQLLITKSIGFRCLVNVTTRTAQWVDSPKQLRCRINGGNLANISMDTNPIQEFSQVKLNCANNQGYNGGDEHGLTYIDFNTGYYMKSYITNIVNTNITYTIGRIANWTSKGGAWDIVNRDVQQLVSRSDSPTFGSEVDNSLMMPVGLNGNKMLLRVMNERNTEKVVRASYGTDNTYSYNLANVGAVPGYAPTADRVAPTIDVWRWRHISYLYNNTVTNWCSILNPWDSGAPIATDANGEYDVNNLRAITWDQAELQRAAEAFARTLDVGSIFTAARCDIMVPQDATLPLLSMVFVRYPTANGQSSRYYVTGVNYTGARTGNITGYSLKTSGYYQRQWLTDNCSGFNDNRSKQPGLVIHRIGNSLLCAMGCSTIAAVPGGLSGGMLLFKYDLTTNVITKHSVIDGLSISPWGGGVGTYPCVLPNYGMLLMDDGLVGPSYSTAMALLPMGSTEADWNSFNYNIKTNRFIIMAQEVKQGWIVYFTETVPVILNGREGTAPITSIDLTTVKANPSNTTFYVYVVENNGVMTYRIAATEEAPTINKMFIGTIVTTGNAIGNIQLRKRSRIGIYQISDTQTGTSIPVSTGLPFQIGDWSWDS